METEKYVSKTSAENSTHRQLADEIRANSGTRVLSVAGEAATSAARTTFEKISTAFESEREGGVWDIFAQRMNGDGLEQQIIVPLPSEGVEVWTGTKSSRGSRELSVTAEFTKYHKTKRLRREQVVHDNTGSVGAILQSHFRNSNFYTQIVMQVLRANSKIGPDGVTLLSNSHPHGGTAVGAVASGFDNLVADALDQTAFNTAQGYLENLTDEDGLPLGLVGNVLTVNPNQQRTAREIFEADERVVAVDNSGAESGTRVAAASMTNVFQGAGTVVVTPYMADGKWTLHDSRYKPLGLCVWRDPEAITLDRMDGQHRFFHDEFLYSQESDFDVVPINPWGIYGNL